MNGDDVDNIRRRREELLKELDRLDAREAAVERFGEDVYENGVVITFSCRYSPGEKLYHYAAIKATNVWWITGRRADAGISWQQLVERHLSRSDDAALVDTVVEL